MTMNFDNLRQQTHSEKLQQIQHEIQNIEKIWYTWLQNNTSTQQQGAEVPHTDPPSVEQVAQTDLDKNSLLVKKYFDKLRSQLIEQKMYLMMTSVQISQFFEEATILIQNKIKLYEDIQKLKLLSTYPVNCKRAYSKQANVILKKWLIDNYSHPYPTPQQVNDLVEETSLSHKQILNWFINARNGLKNKMNPEKKFKLLVQDKFLEVSKKVRI